MLLPARPFVDLGSVGTKLLDKAQNVSCGSNSEIAQCEHMLSAVHPIADIDSDIDSMSERCQQRKSRLYSITSSQTGEHLRRSFGQPGFSQSFFESREVFGTPIRAQHVFESGNTQRGIELQQPSDCLMCLLRPSGHCIACGGDP